MLFQFSMYANFDFKAHPFDNSAKDVKLKQYIMRIQAQLKSAPKDRTKEISLAKAAGISFTNKAFHPASGQDATPLLKGWSKLQTIENFNLPDKFEPARAKWNYTDNEIAQVQKLFDDHPVILDTINKTTARRYLDHEAITKNTTFPEIFFAREEARAIQTYSYLLARDKQYDKAIEWESKGFKIASLIAQEGTLISKLGSLACNLLTLNGMQDILELGGDQPSVAEKIQKAITANMKPIRCTDAYSEGQIAIDWGIYEDLRLVKPDWMHYLKEMGMNGTEDITFKDDMSPKEKELWNRAFYAAEAEYLKSVLDLIKLSKQPNRDIRKLLQSPPEQLTIIDIIDEQTGISLFSFFDTKSLIPDNTIFVREAETLARRNITLAICSVFESKTKSGAYPKSLPANFIDPFSNKPLGYKLEPGGFVIYSVGESGKFDGDLKDSAKADREILFRYPLVKEQWKD